MMVDYQRIFEASPALYLLLSPDLTILNASETYLRATMTQRENIVGRNVFDAFPDNPDDPSSKGVANLRASLEKVLQTRAADRMSILKYDIQKSAAEGGGFVERYWSPLNTPVIASDGSISAIIHMVEDVTESLQIKSHGASEVRKIEEKYRLIIDSVRDYSIIMLSPEGNIVSWNTGAERLLGYTHDEIIGEYFGRFYPSEALKEGKGRRELEAARSNGRFEEESWRVRKNGTQFWANVVVTPIYDEAKRLTGFAKITRDLTERKKTEDHLKQATRELEMQASTLTLLNKELESFSYSVSHDLRAPLRSMVGFSQALIEQYSASLDAQAKDYLERIRRAAKKMGELIDGLLNLSRVTRRELSKETVHLSTLAMNIGEEIKRNNAERKVEFVVADNLVAEGDPQLLQAALTNLLENAWKFTKKTPHAKVEFGSVKKDGKAVYFIKDNGAGFEMAYVDKLFGAFQRLHSANDFEGTGIGLATVQRIILRHGGRIWAEGAPGEGATFYFTL